MNKFLKMFGAAGFLAGMLMIGGCGNDAPPPTTVKAPSAITAATSGTTVITIPAGTSITTTAGGFTGDVPSITASVPASTAGMTPAKSGTSTFTVSSTQGAIDITFNTTGNVTLGTGVDVIIPVTAAPTAPITVVSIKTDGTTQTYTNAVYSAANSTVTVPGVTNFCLFLVNPIFKSSTGSTGSASTFNIR